MKITSGVIATIMLMTLLIGCFSSCSLNQGVQVEYVSGEVEYATNDNNIPLNWGDTVIIEHSMISDSVHGTHFYTEVWGRYKGTIPEPKSDGIEKMGTKRFWSSSRYEIATVLKD